jgi:prepilin-type N-terminal cleavage/methylation domain-containing protein
MNLFPTRRRHRAFTLVELLVVIAIIGVLAALLLPVLEQAKKRAKRILCESHLQQTGIAFHDFAHDHNGKLPMDVSIAEGGAMEFVQAGYQAGGTFYFSYHQFQVLSNALVTPRLLACPSDTRLPAANFALLQNSNLSYFINVKADFLNSGSILAGDRNVATNSYLSQTILQVGSGSYLHWTRELHEYKGNILFGDNHVEEWNDKKLAAAGTTLTADLVLPSAGSSSRASNSRGTASPAHWSYSLSSRPATPATPATRPGAVQPGQNASVVGNRAAPRPSSANSYGNNNGLSKTYGSAAENLQFTNSRAPVIPQQAAVAPDSTGIDDPDAEMSPTDRQIVKVLHGTFVWSYVLILLIVLAYLSYKLWQLLRRTKRPGVENATRQEA